MRHFENWHLFCAHVAPPELLLQNRMEKAWGRGGGGAVGGAGRAGSNEPRQWGQMMWENLTQTKEICSLTSPNPNMDSLD